VRVQKRITRVEWGCGWQAEPWKQSLGRWVGTDQALFSPLRVCLYLRTPGNICRFTSSGEGMKPGLQSRIFLLAAVDGWGRAGLGNSVYTTVQKREGEGFNGDGSRRQFRETQIPGMYAVFAIFNWNEILQCSLVFPAMWDRNWNPYFPNTRKSSAFPPECVRSCDD
jgi:hypothetical protein